LRLVFVSHSILGHHAITTKNAQTPNDRKGSKAIAQANISPMAVLGGKTDIQGHYKTGKHVIDQD